MTKFNEIFANMDEKAAEKKQLRRAQAVACGAVAPCGRAEEFLHRIYCNLDYEREQRRKGFKVIRNLEAEIERLKADLDDLTEKYTQSEADRLDAEAKLERLHQLIEQQHETTEDKDQ